MGGCIFAGQLQPYLVQQSQAQSRSAGTPRADHGPLRALQREVDATWADHPMTVDTWLIAVVIVVVP